MTVERGHIRRTSGLGLLLSVALLGLSACGDAPGTEASESGHPAAALAAKAPGATASATITPVVAAPPALDAARPNDCLIEPSMVVKVNSGIEGVIEGIFVDRGDTVHRGQIVARLRSDTERAALAAAQARAANVHTARAAESRAAYLSGLQQRSESISSYLARDKVEEARANARASAEERNAAVQDRRVAALEAVQTQRILAQKTVISPVNGIVTERHMAPGEYRGADASHILTIAQVNPLNVEVFAPIAQLHLVKVGDMVTVRPEDPVGGSYQARVTVIDRVFDAASGTFGMRLELPNPGNKLPAGLRCRLELARTKQIGT